MKSNKMRQPLTNSNWKLAVGKAVRLLPEHIRSRVRIVPNKSDRDDSIIIVVENEYVREVLDDEPEHEALDSNEQDVPVLRVTVKFGPKKAYCPTELNEFDVEFQPQVKDELQHRSNEEFFQDGEGVVTIKGDHSPNTEEFETGEKCGDFIQVVQRVIREQLP